MSKILNKLSKISLSFSHRQDLDYWKKLDTEGWKDEMVGVRKMMGQFASIPPCEVSGKWYIIIQSSFIQDLRSPSPIPANGW